MKEPDYKHLYFSLFNKMSDLIEEMQQIQREAEEVCMGEDDMPYVWIKNMEA